MIENALSKEEVTPMAEGQGRSSGQGVKLLYIRDYLRKYTDEEHQRLPPRICGTVHSW